MATAAAAGNAVASDVEVKRRRYAPAAAVRLAVSRVRGWARGNPTATALTRLAAALGLRLVITLAPEDGRPGGERAAPDVPLSLVRLGRTARYREAAAAIATALGLDADEFSAQLVTTLAALAHTMGKDLAEADWWRILDALLLIAAHPAAP